MEAPLYATTSSNRIAFYHPGTDEYKRFAEDKLYLQMQGLPGNNQFDFSEVSRIMLVHATLA
jgi:hypothetical protein